MTRRRVIYVRRNGSRYITEEFNGDRAEYAAHTQHIDSCDFDWTEIRSILSRAKTYTEFIKANLEVQASYHSFLKEHGNSGVVRCLRKGRETPLADSLLVIYERPLATGGRSFETDYVCFNPDPDNPYPACLGLKGKEKCTGCKFRHYTQEEQKKQMKGLSEQFGWPEAVHIDGLDVYLCAATKQQDGVEEHTPVYRMPYRDRPVEDWRWRSSKEFYRLRAALEKDPCALASQSDQFQTCPPDWYRELALHAMWALTKTYGAGHFNRSRCDAASQAARSVTKAVFGEQTLFDPYTDQSFLTAAGYLLPTYIRRYTESKRDAETVGEAKNNEH